MTRTSISGMNRCNLDYLIMRGQIDPIENENASIDWMKLDRVARATIRMHLSESVYHVQKCMNYGKRCQALMRKIWRK